VVEPDPITVNSITTDPVSKVTTISLTIDVGYTYVKFTWGDGSTSTTNTDADGSLSQTHQYVRFTKYAVTDADLNTPGDQPGYKYTTTLSLYNGATFITNKNVTVYVLK